MKAKLLSVLVASAFASPLALADTVSWADWSSITTGASGTGVGSLVFGSETVGVSLSGRVDGFNNGSNYYASYPATYGGLAPSDLIQEWNTGSVTLTFAKPVTDVYIALVSVGQGGLPVTYSFDKSFSVISSGPNFWGYTGYTVTGNSFSGKEYNGVLKFAGTHSSLSFSINQPEYWHGFNVGAAVAAVPEPESYAMFLAGIGLLGAVARRRRG